MGKKNDTRRFPPHHSQNIDLYKPFSRDKNKKLYISKCEYYHIEFFCKIAGISILKKLKQKVYFRPFTRILTQKRADTEMNQYFIVNYDNEFLYWRNISAEKTAETFKKEAFLIEIKEIDKISTVFRHQQRKNWLKNTKTVLKKHWKNENLLQISALNSNKLWQISQI